MSSVVWRQRKAPGVLSVGRVKEARPRSRPKGRKLIHIQTASFSILQNGMLDWRGSPNFGSASNKFRHHGLSRPAYPNLTTSLCEWLQFGHSKVRLSCPGMSGSMRASIIDVPHFGQGGRTIAREDA
jgi:hypothetical protein